MTGQKVGRRIGHFLSYVIPAFAIRWFVRRYPSGRRLAEQAIAEIDAEEGLTDDEKQIARQAVGLPINDGSGGDNAQS